MSEEHTSHEEHSHKMGFNWYRLGLWGSIGIIGYFLVTEHRAHLNAYFPYLLLVAVPFMCIFMHGGYGGHAGHSNDRPKQEGSTVHIHGDKKNKEST